MRNPSRLAVVCAVVALFAVAASSALAAGSSSAPKKEAPESPEEKALALYNEGLGYNDQARKLERKLADVPEGAKRDKMNEKAAAAYQASIPLLTEATQINPGMFQAYSELGYAYRKSGKFDLSLEAYDKALTLEPNYTPAIEYRAEAYLGLNRVDEAKQAYDVLADSHPEHASQLLGAMRSWVEARRSKPGAVSTKTVNDFERWIEQRAASAGDKVGHNVPGAKREW